MAKSNILSLSLLFVFILLLCFNMKFANGEVQEQKYWCVGKPSASEAELSANIEYGCSFERVNCSVIQEGGVCFYPNTLINHASVVMNLYYSSMGRNSWNCDFRSSALTVISNPSYGACNYA